MDFNIEESDIIVPDLCPVLGKPLIKTGDGDRNWIPSLDRLDNTKGYIKGNVNVISWRANRLKYDATSDEIRMLYEYTRSA
jgi:hypothetical protein